MPDDLDRAAHALVMDALELDDQRARAALLDDRAGAAPDVVDRARVLLAAMDESVEFLERPVLGSHAAQTPTRIGGYHIVRVLGAGGMATVYEAIQDDPHRRVALKVMRHTLTHTSAVLRFRFETEVLALLQHPGIAQIHEAGAFEDGHGVSTPFFAMEYVEDALPITVYASEHTLPLRARIEMFLEVCDAVHHGHQLGIIHRDLNPGTSSSAPMAGRRSSTSASHAPPIPRSPRSPSSVAARSSSAPSPP